MLVKGVLVERGGSSCLTNSLDVHTIQTVWHSDGILERLDEKRKHRPPELDQNYPGHIDLTKENDKRRDNKLSCQTSL